MSAYSPKLSRRCLLKSALSAGLVAGVSPRSTFAAKEPSHRELPPIRQITHGPKCHWFGYYDKLEFAPDCRLCWEWK